MPINTRVLLVEDNEVMQMLTSAMMDQWHVKYKLAENGLDAVEKWSRLRPDVILMDCQLPKMDGYAATRKIRELEKGESKRPATPIIALTGEDDEKAHKLCFEAGMDDVLLKPFKEDELYAILSKWTAS